VQSCVCELDKYERVRLGAGKPKRRFVPRGGAQDNGGSRQGIGPSAPSPATGNHQGQETGWSVGLNLRIDYRWSSAGDVEQTGKYATKLIVLAPEVILAVATSTVGPLTKTVRKTYGEVAICKIAHSKSCLSGAEEDLSGPGAGNL
jgi:hypothetical protein